MLRQLCPSCQKRLRVPDHAPGHRVQCPACEYIFVWPAGPKAVQPPVGSRTATLPAPSDEEDSLDVGQPTVASEPPAPAPGPGDADEAREHRVPAWRAGPGSSTKGPVRPTSTALVVLAVAIPLIGAVGGMILVVRNWKEGVTERLLGPVFMAVGLFTMMAAALDWDWFTEIFSQRLGQYVNRTGLRIVSAVFGLLVIVMGVLGAVGVMDLRGRQ